MGLWSDDEAGRAGEPVWMRWRSALDGPNGFGTPRLIAGAVLAVVALAVAAFVLTQRGGPPPPAEELIPLVGEVDLPDLTDPSLHVHVAGAVSAPGLYRLPAGSRVADAVAAAGGFVAAADPDRLNLAAVLADGSQVVVPEVGEAAATGAGESGPAGGGGTEAIDLNTAGAEELEELPGIGPAKAAAIVEHREQFGPFQSVDSLADVPGIGPATVDALREAARV